MHIGISGPIASGKSTLAKSLVAVFEVMDIKARIVPFAEDLKWMVGLYGKDTMLQDLRVFFRRLNYPEDVISHAMLNVLHAMIMYPPVDGVKPRKLLQYIGTEVGRDVVDEDLWVSAVQQRIKGDSINQYFISDDLRFPNEAEAVDYHVQIVVDSDDGLSAKAYEARKAMYPPQYFASDHQSEQEQLPLPNYSLPANFTTVEVVRLAKAINHTHKAKGVFTADTHGTLTPLLVKRSIPRY